MFYAAKQEAHDPLPAFSRLFCGRDLMRGPGWLALELHWGPYDDPSLGSYLYRYRVGVALCLRLMLI